MTVEVKHLVCRSCSAGFAFRWFHCTYSVEFPVIIFIDAYTVLVSTKACKCTRFLSRKHYLYIFSMKSLISITIKYCHGTFFFVSNHVLTEIRPMTHFLCWKFLVLWETHYFWYFIDFIYLSLNLFFIKLIFLLFNFLKI